MVTDNCNTMLSVRRMYQEAHPETLVYGCSDHLIDLELEEFVDVISLAGIIDRVSAIIRVFKSHLIFNSALRLAGGKAPTIPANTRWHYAVDMLQNCVDNRSFMRSCIIQNPQLEAVMEKRYKKQWQDLADTDFFQDIDECLSLLKPFKEAIKKVECDSCSPHEVVSIWLDLYDHVSGKLRCINVLMII